MIISDKYKFIYVSMPKCGTHTFYSVIKEFYEGRRYGKFHHIDPPEFNYRDYFIFTSCRNPYDRLVGAWWSTCIIQERFSCGKMEFKDYVSQVFKYRPTYPAVKPQY